MTNTKTWVKSKILSHWEFIGRKTKVFVRRDFSGNRILIDFMEGGYDYMVDFINRYKS
jgi:hypothetical protein